MTVNQILLYTRPWDVAFHIEMARQLRDLFPGATVRFVTFFIAAARAAREAGGDVVYMPDELNRLTGDELSPERFAEIDRELYERTGANYNLMLFSERFLPRDGRRAERFGRKHLVVLDRLVTEGTLSTCAMYDHFVYWLGGSLANARRGAHFAFVGCGMPAGRALALKTPWETWERPGVAREETEPLLEESRISLDIPPEKRIRYMMDLPKAVKSWRERVQVYRDVRHDRRAGSYFAEDHISLPAWLCEKCIPAPLHRRLFRHPEPRYDVTAPEDLAAFSEPFVYLPLHMEPEAVILMYSPWMRDQAEVVRLTAQALPVGWKVCVKENPKMPGSRPVAFYKRLAELPNVRLVAPGVPSAELMQRCEAVVSLAGSSGIEARLMDKPAFCLGAPPFRSLYSQGDISGGALALKHLFELLQQGPRAPLDREAWRKWVAGTLVADTAIVKGAVDSSPANVNAYVEFMTACLQNAEQP